MASAIRSVAGAILLKRDSIAMFRRSHKSHIDSRRGLIEWLYRKPGALKCWSMHCSPVLLAKKSSLTCVVDIEVWLSPPRTLAFDTLGLIISFVTPNDGGINVFSLLTGMSESCDCMQPWLSVQGKTY